MTTPTDLAAVRDAADTVLGRFGCNRADCRYCAKYVFATITADAHLPIDAEWLREVWGAIKHYETDVTVWLNTSEVGKTSIHLAWNSGLILFVKMGNHFSHGNCMLHITTRHQFTQLAACLGLKPKGEK